jgi:uncharacterized protein (DUF1330 family)
MAAYVIVQLRIADPAAFAEYGRRVPATIEKHGGRYLVRGGAVETVEGVWAPERVVVLEFPSMERAKAWYASADYTPLLELRRAASSADFAFVQGV